MGRNVSALSMQRKINTKKAELLLSGLRKLVNCGRTTFAIRRLLSEYLSIDESTMEVVPIGDNHEKMDYVADLARKEGDGPAIGDFESMRETQHAIAMVVKSGKPKRMKWPMDTGCGHDLIGLKVVNNLSLNPRETKDSGCLRRLCTSIFQCLSGCGGHVRSFAARQTHE